MSLFIQDLNPGNRPDTPDQPINSAPTSEQNFALFNSIDGQELVDLIVTHVNYFLLAWSIFYSIVALIEFLEYRIYFGTGKSRDEKRGMIGIRRVLLIWRLYFVCLIFYVLYGGLRETQLGILVGVLTIVLMIAVALIDLHAVLKIYGYFKWSKKLAKAIRKKLPGLKINDDKYE